MAEISRRGFIAKCGTGIAGIIAAGRAPAAIVKSLLSTNGTDFENAPEHIENPYVTDGLICMFDGIWNSGLGKHSDDLHVWKDLANNGYDLQRIGVVETEADCVHFIGGADTALNNMFYHLPTGTYVGQIVKSARVVFEDHGTVGTPGNGKSFITGVAPTNYWSSAYGSVGTALCDRVASDAWRERWFLKGVTFGTTKHSLVIDGPGYQNEPTPIFDGTPASVSYARSLCGVSKYISGKYTDICFGYCRDCRVYGFALYDRQLTEDEINQNWEIDRERFGI